MGAELNEITPGMEATEGGLWDFWLLLCCFGLGWFFFERKAVCLIVTHTKQMTKKFILS